MRNVLIAIGVMPGVLCVLLLLLYLMSGWKAQGPETYAVGCGGLALLVLALTGWAATSIRWKSPAKSQ